MFEFKPDYEKTRERIAAFWERELIDRPVVMFGLAKPPEQQVPYPASHHVAPAERWTDAQYHTDLTLATMCNHEFLGDTLPVAYPNLGPEIFSALYGCPIHFGDYGTSWTDPILHDWSEADSLQLDWHSPWLAKLDEMTDSLLEAGQGQVHHRHDRLAPRRRRDRRLPRPATPRHRYAGARGRHQAAAGASGDRLFRHVQPQLCAVARRGAAHHHLDTVSA